MKKETLKELCKMQKRYAEIYHTPEGLCGISEDYIHMLAEDFLELFDEYEVEELTGKKYEQLSATYCGVKIIALRDKEK